MTTTTKRCKSCGFHIRGANHEKGDHHSGRPVKVKDIVVSLGPRKVREAKTSPKSKGHGFDFSHIKTGR